tara:strand:- start:1550 stop:2518 length:969 start_codon:yes stop_codon:yes gene_type:complete
MADFTYADLKKKVINSGGLDNSYSADNLDINTVFPIPFTGTATIDLGTFQDEVLALKFEEESDQTFDISADIDSLDGAAVKDLTGIDADGLNVYTPKTGGSIFLNSDRVVINAKEDFAMLFGEKGVAIASPERVNIDAGTSVTLFGHSSVFLGLPNRGEPYEDKATIDKPTPASVGDSTNDELYEPMALGLKLINFLEDLIVTIENSEIAGPVGNGVFQPSSLAEFELLKVRLPELVSNYAYVDGLSHEEIDTKRLATVKKAKANAQDYVPPRTLTGTVAGNVDQPPPGGGADQNPVTSPFAQQPGYYETPQEDLYNDSGTL